MLTTGRLVSAVLAALPIDPDSDSEMVTGYETVHVTAEDRAAEPALPESYSVPIFGDAEGVARKVVRAVLLALAEEMDASAPTYLAMLDEVSP